MAQAQATIAELEIRELPFPADAGSRLARLGADTELGMPDCCVLLAAEQAAARLASFDDRLSRVARSRNVVVLDSRAVRAPR